MSRSIPYSRMLINIEILERRTFKENLSYRQDKEYLNKLFPIHKLYCYSLSHLSKSIITEPILLSVFFKVSNRIMSCRLNLLHNNY